MQLRRYLARYNDYMPLNAHSTPKSTPKSTSLTNKSFLVMCIFAVSIIVNLVFIVTSLMAWPSPLDDYQNLYVCPEPIYDCRITQTTFTGVHTR